MRVGDIIQKVASIYGVQVEDVMSRRRDRQIVDCRTVIFYTLCELHKMPLKHAGQALHRHHADVIYHVAKGKDWVENPILNFDGSAAILEMECQMRRIFA